MPPPELSQANRYLKVSTALKEDTFILRSFDGTEQVSRPYKFELELYSSELWVDPVKMVGKPSGFSVKGPDDALRFFHGVVRNFSAGPVIWSEEYPLRRYRAEVVPWLTLLKLQRNSRVFQEKTPPDIVEQVFKDAGYTDYKLSLKGSYEKLDFCVQYRESHYDFVSRMMEKAGIFYYFTHDKAKHTLVLADSATGYVDAEENVVELLSAFEAQEFGRIESWENRFQITPGKYVVEERSFLTPSKNDQAKEKTKVKWKGVADWEVYDYPGTYGVTKDKFPAATTKGQAVVGIERHEAKANVAHGTSSCMTFSPGAKFKLKFSEVTDENNLKYALTFVRHKAYEPIVALRDSQKADEKHADEERTLYSNSFKCIPADVPARPQLRTAKPSVQGPQSATVVGPKNSHIFTDEHGRVKVAFHWDRESKLDDKSSCWLRVAQSWAGAKWGGLFIPRVGHEVLVEFLEGDPDRPIVTGSVYNKDNALPYKLPDESYKSTIKSETVGSKGKNYNEIRFEDKEDKEMFHVHAARDFERIVKNDDVLKVGFETKEDGKQTIDIFKDRTVTIHEGNEKFEILKGKRDTLVYDKETLVVKSGDHLIDVKAGKSTLQAAKSILLKVGGSSIKIDTQGITIKAPQVKIQGQVKVDIKSPMTGVGGDGMLTLKGGMVKIN